jgi:hypothetical protein
MNRNRKRRPTKIEFPPMSFGGWGDYEVWAEHGFTPKPKSVGKAEPAPEPPPAEPDEPPAEPSWPVVESPPREPLGMREHPRPRPYVRGTRLPPPPARPALPPEVMLTTTGRHRALGGLDPELAAVCRMCQIPTSVAEVSAYLLRPLEVTRSLVLRGIEDGLIVAQVAELGVIGRPPLDLLHRVHQGLLRLA